MVKIGVKISIDSYMLTYLRNMLDEVVNEAYSQCMPCHQFFGLIFKSDCNKNQYIISVIAGIILYKLGILVMYFFTRRYYLLY